MQIFWNKLKTAVWTETLSQNLICQMVAGKIMGNRMLFKSSHYNDLATTNKTIKDLANVTNYSHSTLLCKQWGLAAGILFKCSTMKTWQYW